MTSGWKREILVCGAMCVNLWLESFSSMQKTLRISGLIYLLMTAVRHAYNWGFFYSVLNTGSLWPKSVWGRDSGLFEKSKGWGWFWGQVPAHCYSTPDNTGHRSVHPLYSSRTLWIGGDLGELRRFERKTACVDLGRFSSTQEILEEDCVCGFGEIWDSGDSKGRLRVWIWGDLGELRRFLKEDCVCGFGEI